jgi:predicted NBD/HSP70 family sugar kinase
VIDHLGFHAVSNYFARDVNRQIVLNLIRTRQPISRADLARLSGMQKSTISLIVEELVEQDWVIEGPTSHRPRGRRPTFLRLNDERAIIGVDIRPTQTIVGVSDVNGKFLSQWSLPTPRDAHAAMNAIIGAIGLAIRACDGRKIEGIGVSVPGPFNQQADRMTFAPNLGWHDVDLHGPITAATGLDVALENEANACILAALWFDRMDQSRNLVALTVTEGIGAGILVNGQLARGLADMAGEFGHFSLDPEGPLCSCGRRGCWEVFGSNRAALRYYAESTSRQAASFLDLLRLAEQGDQDAVAALEKMAHYLGRGLRMIVAGLAPEQILIIGDLTRAWRRFGPILEAQVREQLLPGGRAPQLLPAPEDGLTRLRGTIALVLQKDFGMVRAEQGFNVAARRSPSSPEMAARTPLAGTGD